MAVVAQVYASISLSVHDVGCVRTTSIRQPISLFAPKTSTFASGSPLLVARTSCRTKSAARGTSISIKCEQRTPAGNSLDIWIGRSAMVGFAVAITIEIATGKGLLENFGLTTPLPTAALAVTGLVGVLTAVFIFQSASKN